MRAAPAQAVDRPQGNHRFPATCFPVSSGSSSDCPTGEAYAPAPHPAAAAGRPPPRLWPAPNLMQHPGAGSGTQASSPQRSTSSWNPE